MKFKQLLGFLLLLAVLSPLDCVAKGKRWFTLVNQSGYIIDYMYVRPLNAGEWSDDILGQDHLGSGESVDVTWSGAKLPAVFDVHIQYEDGETAELTGLNPPNKFTKLYITWDQTTHARWE